MCSMRHVFDLRRWSLRLRLTGYFFLVTSALLGTVGWILFDQLTHQLWEKDEAIVRSSMEARNVVVRSIADANAALRAKEWAEQPGQRDLNLRLIAPDGEVLGVQTQAIPDAAYPQATLKGALKRYTVRSRGGEQRYMLAASRIETEPNKVWTLQATYDVTESEQLIAQFGRGVIGVMTAAILAASALAAWLVHQGLRPLRAMNEAMSAITADNLDNRISSRAWPSDLAQLAGSFDAMLKRLQAAFEQLSRFSSDLAHEFRSPITNLVAAASVMLSRERSPLEYQETLEVVVNEGDRLARMVSSMLFLARADNARQVIHKESIAIAGYLQQIVETYDGVAEEQGIRLQASGHGNLLADPLLLRNALSNLVSNALQHTPSGGSVVLSGTPAGDGVELVVADTGGGIAQEHVPHIFERFYRADSARSSGDRTGLGLAVVRSIADLHGGRVTVESLPGTGSRFVIWLPGGATQRPDQENYSS